MSEKVISECVQASREDLAGPDILPLPWPIFPITHNSFFFSPTFYSVYTLRIALLAELLAYCCLSPLTARRPQSKYRHLSQFGPNAAEPTSRLLGKLSAHRHLHYRQLGKLSGRVINRAAVKRGLSDKWLGTCSHDPPGLLALIALPWGIWSWSQMHTKLSWTYQVLRVTIAIRVMLFFCMLSVQNVYL